MSYFAQAPRDARNPGAHRSKQTAEAPNRGSSGGGVAAAFGQQRPNPTPNPDQPISQGEAVRRFVEERSRQDDYGDQARPADYRAGHGLHAGRWEQRGVGGEAGGPLPQDDPRRRMHEGGWQGRAAWGDGGRGPVDGIWPPPLQAAAGEEGGAASRGGGRGGGGSGGGLSRGHGGGARSVGAAGAGACAGGSGSVGAMSAAEAMAAAAAAMSVTEGSVVGSGASGGVDGGDGASGGGDASGGGGAGAKDGFSNMSGDFNSTGARRPAYDFAASMAARGPRQAIPPGMHHRRWEERAAGESGRRPTRVPPDLHSGHMESRACYGDGGRCIPIHFEPHILLICPL